MTDAVKLLTEAEWANLMGLNVYDKVSPTLRERGLIAPEPVDPLLIEARNVVGDYAARTKGYGVYEAPYRQGKRDSDSEVQIALAALKRGMEMRAPLTDTINALGDLLSWFPEELTGEYYKVLAGRHGADDAIEFARATLGHLKSLHAALTKEQS